MRRQIRVGLGILFSTDIVGRRACSCAALFYVLYLLKEDQLATGRAISVYTD